MKNMFVLSFKRIALIPLVLFSLFLFIDFVPDSDARRGIISYGIRAAKVKTPLRDVTPRRANPILVSHLRDVDLLPHLW